MSPQSQDTVPFTWLTQSPCLHGLLDAHSSVKVPTNKKHNANMDILQMKLFDPWTTNNRSLKLADSISNDDL